MPKKLAANKDQWLQDFIVDYYNTGIAIEKAKNNENSSSTDTIIENNEASPTDCQDISTYEAPKGRFKKGVCMNCGKKNNVSINCERR